MKKNLFANLFKSKKQDAQNNYKLVQNLSSEATNRFLSKQYEIAIVLTDKILLVDKNNYNALSTRAMSLENLGYYLDAIDDYNRAIELKPDDANLLGSCGLCYNSIGEFQMAKEYLTRAVNFGMKMYATNLYSINSLSEKTLALMKENRSTPERKKRRIGNEFTISNSGVDLNDINQNLREYFENIKGALSVDPENKDLKELVAYYKQYFEET